MLTSVITAATHVILIISTFSDDVLFFPKFVQLFFYTRIITRFTKVINSSDVLVVQTSHACDNHACIPLVA
jgi:hypothetical protein